MTQHTPGLWTVDSPYTDEEWSVISGSRSICDIIGTMPVDLANARLIAAAPDLLEALKNVIAKFESDPDDLGTMDDGIAIARAAIAKATQSADKSCANTCGCSHAA